MRRRLSKNWWYFERAELKTPKEILKIKFLFLGIDIRHTAGDIYLSMATFLNDKLTTIGVTGTERYPHKLA